MSNRPRTPAEIKRLKRLYALGYNNKQIAHFLRRTPDSVLKWTRQLIAKRELPPTRPKAKKNEISTRPAIPLEILRERLRADVLRIMTETQAQDEPRPFKAIDWLDRKKA